MTPVPHSGAKSVTPGGSVAGGDADLFGQPIISNERKDTLFGVGLDRLARERGGWPDDAMLYAVEVIGKGKDPMVLATGGVPVGWRADGRPKFGPRVSELKAGFLISEYRAALTPAKATAGETRNAEPIHRRDGDEG